MDNYKWSIRGECVIVKEDAIYKTWIRATHMFLQRETTDLVNCCDTTDLCFGAVLE